MTFVVYALLFLWLPACVTALVFLVRPSRRWPVFGTRLRSLLMLIALVFGVPVLLTLIAPDSMRAKPGDENKPAPVATAAAPASTPAAASSSAPKAATSVDGDADAARNPQRYLELSDVKAAKGRGRTVLVSGKIFNGADLTIRNPLLKCYLSVGRESAGTVSGTVRRAIPAGDDIVFHDLDMGDSDGVWTYQVCEIVGAEAVEKKKR